MRLNLAGKSVIVTGGGSNIGRAISLAFAEEGVHLTLAEIDEGQGRKVATEASKIGAASATLWRKRNASVPAHDEIIDEARRGVDVVVAGIGD